jgi:CRP-like cAMP-binding protein
MQQLNDYIRTSFNTEVTEAEHISQYFHPQLLRKGDFLMKAGRVCDRMAFVASGLIRIFMEAGDKEVTQWIVTKNYFTTDLSSFMLSKPGRFNMQALEDSEIWVIEQDDYRRMAKAVPRWVEFERLLLIHCFIYMEERIFSHLCMSAEERFQQLFIQQPDLFNQVPLQYLASMLGMTPETLSRMRKKMLA